MFGVSNASPCTKFDVKSGLSFNYYYKLVGSA